MLAMEMIAQRASQVDGGGVSVLTLMALAGVSQSWRAMIADMDLKDGELQFCTSDDASTPGQRKGRSNSAMAGFEAAFRAASAASKAACFESAVLLLRHYRCVSLGAATDVVLGQVRSYPLGQSSLCMIIRMQAMPRASAAALSADSFVRRNCVTGTGPCIAFCSLYYICCAAWHGVGLVLSRLSYTRPRRSLFRPTAFSSPACHSYRGPLALEASGKVLGGALAVLHVFVLPNKLSCNASISRQRPRIQLWHLISFKPHSSRPDAWRSPPHASYMVLARLTAWTDLAVLPPSQMVRRAGHLLENITLAQSPAVTDDGLLCLAAAPRLRSLTLRQLPGVTGATFPALAAGCAALETLDMQVSLVAYAAML